MNDNGPDGTPPPDSFSLEERIVERSVPVPEPGMRKYVRESVSFVPDSAYTLVLIDPSPPTLPERAVIGSDAAVLIHDDSAVVVPLVEIAIMPWNSALPAWLVTT